MAEPIYGVYEYPDLQTRQRLANMYEAVGFSRYFETSLTLGAHPSMPNGEFKIE